MQFFLNGFRAGNPDIQPEAVRQTDSDVVDVLVIGAGPAGSLLATHLADFPHITTRLIDSREVPMTQGQADGVQCRTVEMFQAFGLADKLNREACPVTVTTFWGPDADNKGIVRTGRTLDLEPGISEYQHVVVNQARLQDYLVEKMGNSPTRLKPEWGMQAVDVQLPAEESDPVLVTVRQLSLPGQPTTVIKARYVVGCDGARSVVRNSLGLKLIGDPQNHAWGVMDVFPVTDFPDIRRKSIINGPEGGLAVIPREGGYMIRLYVDQGSPDANDPTWRDRITKEQIVKDAQRLFKPYSFDARQVSWWSIYEIAQRVTDRFDDVPDAERGTRSPRVFIAGDACHTHSAKAGGGMNVSMQDTFNLAWKLIAVLEGRSPVSLLDTYTAERQPIGKEWIEFDRWWAKMVDGQGVDGQPVSTEAIRERFQDISRYTAGVATCYPSQLLIGGTEHQALAAGYPVGMRFHSAPVARLSDAFRLLLGHTHVADGRWRLYAFADAAPITSPASKLRALCEYLSDNANSPVRRFTPAGADIDAVFDVRAILQQSWDEVETTDLPALLLPSKGALGLQDYEKVFVPDINGGENIFDARQIDRQKGALVVVRPDQYVAQVLPLDAHDQLAAFFAGFMTPAS